MEGRLEEMWGEVKHRHTWREALKKRTQLLFTEKRRCTVPGGTAIPGQCMERTEQALNTISQFQKSI